jgi:small-conductance mechanosensitive channel
MLLRVKFTLLAVFLVFTLLGLAAPSVKALLIGISALGLALALSVTNFVTAEPKPGRKLRSSF